MKKYIFACVTAVAFVGFSSAFFSDVIDHSYAESILVLHNKGIISWYPDGTFKPNQSITRAEILKIILEAKIPADWTSINHVFDCFPDATDQWYAIYVCYAKQNNIVKGYPDGKFKPDNAVTFAEWLKMALEAFDAPAQEEPTARWYNQYINFVHNNNIFSKYAINPDRSITRWEITHLVHQLLREQQWDITFDNKRSNLSAGCLRPNQPSSIPYTSMINGIQREYITTVGSRYNHNIPTKLIFAFHGRTNSNEEVQWYYNIDRVWDKDGIIVYPAGLPAGGGRGRSDGGDRSNALRDFALFDQLVQEFWDNYCIDMDEIYVVGHSLGAWFTNTLACARGDVIRAIGSVGWSITKNNCSGPVAAIIMHNPKDNLASFGGWEYARDVLLEQNGCYPEQYRSVGPADGNCIEYTNCIDGATVVWCPHTQDYGWGSYYPHNRPEFAADEIWSFFQEQ